MEEFLVAYDTGALLHYTTAQPVAQQMKGAWYFTALTFHRMTERNILQAFLRKVEKKAWEAWQQLSGAAWAAQRLTGTAATSPTIPKEIMAALEIWGTCMYGTGEVKVGVMRPKGFH